MLSDLIATRERLRSGTTTAAAELARCTTAAQAPFNAHTFVRTLFDSMDTPAALADRAHLPLAGLAVSVKDLFDMAGQPTPAWRWRVCGRRALRSSDAPTWSNLRSLAWG